MAKKTLKEMLDDHRGHDRLQKSLQRKAKDAQRKKARDKHERAKRNGPGAPTLEEGSKTGSDAKKLQLQLPQDDELSTAQWETEDDDEVDDGEEAEDGDEVENSESESSDKQELDLSRFTYSDSEEGNDSQGNDSKRDNDSDESNDSVGKDPNPKKKRSILKAKAQAETTANVAAEGDADGSIALSDLDSVASEELGDVVPHQRLTINDTRALHAALRSIRLPEKLVPFSEHLVVTLSAPDRPQNVEDEMEREMTFYTQAAGAARHARKLLRSAKTPFSRPTDFFAEMVKSEEQMGRVKARLVNEAAAKRAAATARRQRDLRKFGKQVQVARVQERAREKRDAMDRIGALKRKRKGAELTATAEDGDLFDVELDHAATASPRRGGSAAPPSKRQKRDARFGFGGKKRHAKSGDALSTSGLDSKRRGASQGGSRGGARGGRAAGAASKRPGKSRRAKKL